MAGGLLALRLGRHWANLIAFAGGVLIGVALIDILPETIRTAGSENIPALLLAATAALGFVFLASIGRIGRSYPSRTDSGRVRAYGPVAATEMVAHGLFEGVAIGVGFSLGAATGLVISVAIVLHVAYDGLGLVAIATASGYSRRTALAILLIESIAPTLGVVFALLLAVPAGISASVLAFIAGGLLYVGALELLLRSVQGSKRAYEPVSLGIIGLALIFLSSLL